MAATSYSTLPSSTYVGFGSQGDPYHSNNYGTYDLGIGSLTSHPYQYQTNSYSVNPMDNQQQSHYPNDYHQPSYSTQQPQNVPTNTYAQQQQQQQQQLHGYSNPQISKNNDRSQATNNNTGNYANTKTIQPPHKKNMDNQHVESKNHQQNSHAGATQHHPSPPVDNQHHQSNLIRSERQISNHPPKQQHHKSQPPPQSHLIRSDHQISKAHVSPPPIRHRSPSNDHHIHAPETVRKTNNPSRDLKPTKSSMMRAAATKKKEQTREQKRKDQFFPASQTKTTPTNIKSLQASPQSDAEQSDKEKTKPNKKQSHLVSKTQKHSHSDGEQTDTGKINRDKKKSHSQTKQHKSRRDDYQTEDHNSSGDDDDHHHKRHRNKSQKRATFSDSHLDKHPHLPPIRRTRMPPHYDPYLDHHLPPGHPLRGRFQYDDYPPYGHHPSRYPFHHLYEDADNIPPYLAPYHDPYDPFFDYQKRKAKPTHNPHTEHEDHNGGVNEHETVRDDGARSELSRKSKHKTNNNTDRKSRRDYEENMRSHWPPDYYPPPYYHEPDMLEIWRQERNDYLKKTFKPTIHDVLYSQQWMKSDSYLENQRRRTLRDAQGYYFPYKKYTLKDYKDMQKLNNQNPFADVQEITIDRKERAKKRQEYGQLVERQMVDNPGTRHIPHREMPPRKPWHLSNGETNDSNMASKRERVDALEYAKEQVKHRPTDSTKNRPYESDPTKHYVNNLFPQTNDYGDGSNNEHTDRTHQLYDDYE